MSEVCQDYSSSLATMSAATSSMSRSFIFWKGLVMFCTRSSDGLADVPASDVSFKHHLDKTMVRTRSDMNVCPSFSRISKQPLRGWQGSADGNNINIMQRSTATTKQQVQNLIVHTAEAQRTFSGLIVTTMSGNASFRASCILRARTLKELHCLLHQKGTSVH